ncbi:hypothetical protein LC613_41400 [Nostoc sphaeroides CHAB 2801]|uniref:hypothetical protein n=1 Tax=Nostoc sphaeroides TaxID=446679 RepID=UPI001E5D0F34|nr:hypothetical protein [Nostoc sphaeroides]MCC5633875.1 hypothetical protein [Nostoc sphaeroides CHAB 2801]
MLALHPNGLIYNFLCNCELRIANWFDELFTFRDAIALGGTSPIARVTDYDLERVRV